MGTPNSFPFNCADQLVQGSSFRVCEVPYVEKHLSRVWNKTKASEERRGAFDRSSTKMGKESVLSAEATWKKAGVGFPRSGGKGERKGFAGGRSAELKFGTL